MAGAAASYSFEGDQLSLAPGRADAAALLRSIEAASFTGEMDQAIERAVDLHLL